MNEKRAQIIDAAVAEFREKGFTGASMDRVSTRANVSKRTVYNHFESKEALFRAILDLMAAEADEALDLHFDPDKPIKDQLLDLGWAEGKLFIDPDFMKLARMVTGETMRDPALAAEMNAKMDPISTIRRFLKAAHSARAIDTPDIERAADQFCGLIKAQGFWPVIYSGQVVSEDQMQCIVRTTVSMFLKQYGVPVDSA